jgi:hypothetical protein
MEMGSTCGLSYAGNFAFRVEIQEKVCYDTEKPKK